MIHRECVINTYLYLSLCAVVVFCGGFNLAFNKALQLWGRKLVGIKSVQDEIEDAVANGMSRAEATGHFLGKSVGNRGVMDGITPQIQNMSFNLFFGGAAVMAIIGFFAFRWYTPIVAFIGCIVLGGPARNLFPKQDSPFWIKIIYRDLKRREQMYRSSGDGTRVDACQHFIGLIEDQGVV